jgi:hypothetical protein
MALFVARRFDTTLTAARESNRGPQRAKWTRWGKRVRQISCCCELRGEPLRRLLAVGAFVVLLFAAFALTDAPTPAHAAAPSGPPAILVQPPSITQRGCPIGSSFTFCDQAPGTAGPPVQFNIEARSAVSSVAVSIAAIPGLAANFAAGDFTVSANTCTGNLAANQDCQISVSFSPTTIGSRQAQVSVTDSAGDSVAFNIEGRGTQVALAPPAEPPCSPGVLPDNSFRFCAEAVGATSGTETFTLSSGSGATGVNVSLVAIAGLEAEFASGDFTIESTTCTGALPPNGSCTIDVAFTPTAVGGRSAQLTASDSAGDDTTIYLMGPTTSGLVSSGAGLSNPAPCAVISDYFDFCNMPVGGVSTAVTLSFVNSSGTQLTGLSVPKGSVIAQGATAADFTVQNTSCASVLAAGATCNVTVAFTPTTSGLRQGAITVTDAQGDVATVNLAGYGDDYSIATQLPTELSVIPGNSVTFNAMLTPDNVFGMNGEQVTFVCPGDLPANTSCVATPCPATIMPGTPVAVKVALATSSALAIVPVPTSGCSSYGPSVSASTAVPPARRSPPPAARAGPLRLSALSSALLLFAGLGAIGLLLGLFVPTSAGRRRRAAAIIMSAGLAAAILTGCHHHGAAVTTATPNATTTFTVFGNAVDANGNSLNASRPFQVTLDVVTK